jgi:lipopolysaccharide biosynthesis glycosyltransferase
MNAIFCTVITKRYLAQARVLTQSLQEYHPEAMVYVLLADRIDGYFDPAAEPFKLIALTDLPNQPLVQQLCFYYNALELCCALRPWLHAYLDEHTDHAAWLFLDADILVCASLEPLWQQLETASILLSPHLLASVAPAHVEMLELNVLRLGTYNGGCLGLRRGAATGPTASAHAFIQWWQQRLTDYCFDDGALQDARGLAWDQKWLNLVPLYFTEVAILRHGGANVGHWNLIERGALMATDSGFQVGNEPLLFLHFSGWDWHEPLQVSRHNPLYADYQNEAWSQLALGYRDRLRANGHEAALAYPYAFDRFDNGEPILPPMRQAYYRRIQAHQKAAVEPEQLAIDLTAVKLTVAESPFASPEQFQGLGNPPGTSVILLQQALAAAQQALAEARTAVEPGLTQPATAVSGRKIGQKGLGEVDMADVQSGGAGSDAADGEPVRMDRLIQTIRAEVAQRGDRRFEGDQGQGAMALLVANEIEMLVNQAEAKAHSRQKWPDRLNRFPFNLSRKVQKAVLKLVDLLFRDQREVNLLLVQSLRQSLTLQRQLIRQLAAAEQADDDEKSSGKLG